jgi:hypothetical protein
MALVYSTVLEGKPLGPRVRMKSEEWQETGGTYLPLAGVSVPLLTHSLCGGASIAAVWFL